MWFNLIYCPHRVSREKKETERIKERKLSRPPRHHHCSDSLCLVVVVIECSSLHTVQGIIMTLFWWMMYDLTSFNSPSIKLKFSYDWFFFWFCSDSALILLWFCSASFLVLQWFCSGFAVILYWFCCDFFVILLWFWLIIESDLGFILLWFHSDLLKNLCWLFH